jgi:phage regulator Rha-like protein
MEVIVPIEAVERRIYLIRGHKVMLDKDLAELYGVKPIRLREQVKRNMRRFPDDFMFQLNEQEIDIMVSQNAIPSRKHLGGYQPYVFTEQGVAMLATVLNSERAILANIAIMRAFVKLREILSTHKELAHKLAQFERKIEKHDDEIKVIFNAIRQLMSPPESKKKKIGFRREHES